MRDGLATGGGKLSKPQTIHPLGTVTVYKFMWAHVIYQLSAELARLATHYP